LSSNPALGNLDEEKLLQTNIRLIHNSKIREGERFYTNLDFCPLSIRDRHENMRGPFMQQLVRKINMQAKAIYIYPLRPQWIKKAESAERRMEKIKNRE